jgi:glutamate/aspartate transport system substrate-binding protein
MRKSLQAALLLMTCAGPLAGSVSAQQTGNTLKTITDTKSIRMGYLRESVPFSFVDQNGDPSGYSIDLCKRVAAGVQQQLNLPDIAIKWVPVTLANRFDLVSSGGIDLECGTSTNSLSRQKQVDFSVMTWVDGGNFVVKAGQPHHSLADLAGKKIAVVGGTTTESGLRAALKKGYVNAEIVTVSKHLDGLNALQKGEVDAYASDQTVLIGLALAIRDQMRLDVGEQNFSYEPYGLVLRRNDADFKQAVNTVLARLYRSDEIVQIYKRWFGGLGEPAPGLVMMFGLNGLPE